MKTFDKGTVIRTVLLFIALINQTLVMVGQTVRRLVRSKYKPQVKHFMWQVLRFLLWSQRLSLGLKTIM